MIEFFNILDIKVSRSQLSQVKEQEVSNETTGLQIQKKKRKRETSSHNV